MSNTLPLGLPGAALPGDSRVPQELEQAATRAIADAGPACVVLSHTYVSFASLLV
jgi:hypothetical protein